ncbi:beta-glucoside-specific PTS transporter subunit IIABC [Paenibacillus sp. S02]|uniref:beta-glucoside-specific PTS transporter subunit IIABC n=1 Tax=Paenibacillus sp. S02 TaxID=2823904 RepID=UPI001C6518E5|nr:beta-glucoside-specific PTS transporter subunit IIABC [Paenibacillus sp. S02]QYK66251.1 PTS system beta-glucoside-specific EIIBCA component [Paenibacillus sp. S02]
MDRNQLSKEILTLVGGEENVEQVIHCMTRLRFNLHDDKKAQKEQLQKTDGVMGVMESGGQFQVIIGNDVANVYKSLVSNMSKAPQSDSGASTASKKKQNPISKLFDFIAGMFTPILPAITGAGMIKGIIALLVAMNWMSDKSQTYTILAAIGDGAFYFLPIILAVSAARKLGSNMFISAAIGASILHPTITALLASNVKVSFIGLPVTAATYSSTVIPIVIAVWLASYVEKFIDKYTHASLKLLVVPTLTLLIIVPLTLVAVGPLGSIIGNGLSGGISWLFENTGALAGLLLGGTFSLIIMTGMHYALVPIMIGSIATLGFDYMIPIMGAANLAQAGAALGVFLKSKNAKVKTVAFSTSLTAIMGVTEPAMYGVNMRFKKPFTAALIGGAVGGGFMSLFGTKAYVMGGLVGVPGLAMFIGPTFLYAILGLIIAFVVATIVTYLIGFTDEKNEEAPQATTDAAGDISTDEIAQSAVSSLPKGEKIPVYSPIMGEVKPLSEVNDPAFSQEIMGRGWAIEPSEGRVVSPVDGTVFSISKSGHAVGLVSDSGLEMLIHVGMDTVKLKGLHFTPHLKAGDRVKVGDLVLEFDLVEIRKAGYETITPVIVTNVAQFSELESADNQHKVVKEQELLYTVIV